MKNTLNFIDLFCGAGGFSCGLEMSGLNCILGVDFDANAVETFKANHKNALGICGDISKLKNADILESLNNQTVNLIVGGPPCQGFSTVGKGNPKDSRNSLFMQFLRVVKLLNPEFVIIENVTGLMAKKNEKVLKKIISKFDKLGYKIEFQVLSATQYGVPENRKRTIIMGTRLNVPIQFPKLIKKNPKSYKTVGDVLFDLSYRGRILNHDIEHAQIKSQLDFKRIKKIPEGKGIRYKHDEDNYLPKKLKFDIDWDNLPEKRFRQTKLQRLDRTKPSPTIMTHRHNYFHPTENRYLTQREAAKLQSFPNKFIFTGPVTSQWRQIGNAVPPLLAKALGKSIQEMFQENKETRKTKSSNKKIRSSKNKDINEVRKKAFQYTL